MARGMIVGIGSYLPEEVRTSLALEAEIRAASSGILFPGGSIEALTGVKSRRRASADENASDLAAQAAKRAIANASIDANQIDCLIFAAASSDLTEPATANIVQEKLGLSCPVFDVKNACNSFLNGVDVAESLIASGKYRCILVATGEKLSAAIRIENNGKEQLRNSFASFTFGDAGAAAIIAPAIEGRGIVSTRFSSYGSNWRYSMVPGGGSMHPHEEDKTYFEGQTEGLKDVFLKIGPDQFNRTLADAGWSLDVVDVIVLHQVSSRTFEYFSKLVHAPKEKLIIVLPELGNMAAASIPVSLDVASRAGKLKSGDKVMLVGLAAGVSIATMALVW